jgi:hypothetical protein
MICDYCRYQIAEGQPTCQLSFGEIKVGKKAGRDYHSNAMEVPYITHQQCLLSFLSLEQEVRDMIRDQLLAEIRQDEIEDLKAIALSEAADDLANLCAECQKSKTDPDTPPDEYSCSDCGSGAMPICPDCGEPADIAVDAVASAA